jgi:hypothetical protein
MIQPQAERVFGHAKGILKCVAACMATGKIREMYVISAVLRIENRCKNVMHDLPFFHFHEALFQSQIFYTRERLEIPTAVACFTRLQPQCKTGQRSEQRERRSAKGALRAGSGNEYY